MAKRKGSYRQRRNEAFFMCKRFALNGNYLMAKAWLERADKLCPVTDMQIWRVKNILGMERFIEIAPKRLSEYFCQKNP